MKKIESRVTLSSKLKNAINKDLTALYNEAVKDLDYYGTLEILRDCGVDALPETKKVLTKIEGMENDSFASLHDLWGLKRPFGLSNLEEV